MHGIGIVTVHTQAGDQKKLHGVQYILGLAHNLLSVGQLLANGYSVMFKDDKCIISNNHASNQAIIITRSQTT